MSCLFNLVIFYSYVGLLEGNSYLAHLEVVSAELMGPVFKLITVRLELI
jgi:hypothetical protein